MTHPIKNIIHQFESQSVSDLDKQKNLDNILNQLNIPAKKKSRRIWFFPAFVISFSVITFTLGFWLGQRRMIDIPVQNMPNQKEAQPFQKPEVIIKDTVFVFTKETKKPVIKNVTKVYTDIHSNDAEFQHIVFPSDASFLIQQSHIAPEEDSVIQVVHADIAPPSQGIRTRKSYATPVFLNDTIKAKEISLKWKYSSGGLMHSASIKRQ